jgi:uncharacterized protein (TIGR02145 family)
MRKGIPMMALITTILTLHLLAATTSTETSFRLNIKVILEGAYTPGQAYLMHTLLNPVLPEDQPYGPELPWFGNQDPHWYYPGDESVSITDDNVVDWVLIEIRDAQSPLMGNTVVGRQAALLMNNGHIRDIQGQLPLFNLDIVHNLYVVVYHRNHLTIMSALPLNIENGLAAWDFTTSASQAFNNGQKTLAGGLAGMFGGDGDANGQVQIQDKNNVWEIQTGLSGYLAGDFNLNTQVQHQDKNLIWELNTGASSKVSRPLAQGTDGKPCDDLPWFVDPRDGTRYTTTMIGNQCWMKQNLKFLPRVESPVNNTGSLTQPFFYVLGYHGSSVEEAKQNFVYQMSGVLYNWPAANTSCPAGWRLASQEDWIQMINYLMNTYQEINEQNIGTFLRSCRQNNSPLGGDCDTNLYPAWNEWEIYGSDEFNFSALPGGQADPPCCFLLSANAYWWTSNQGQDEFQATGVSMGWAVGGIYYGVSGPTSLGKSVRCIKE